MSNRLRQARRDRQRSSALIITLAAVVLLSALIIVFFQAATLHRQMSFSSAGQYQAEATARIALDTIVGDLRTEIAAGSTVEPDPSGGANNIYIPTANLTAVPSPVFTQGFTNLVAQSAGTSNFWTGTGYGSTVSPIRAAANNSTLNASLNGRRIALAEWNRPGLLADPGSGTTPQVPGTYVPPDWIVVTRQGPLANASVPSATVVGPGPGTLSDKSPGNMNYAVGRYAYAIYDEGGLLDVNVAGFPSGAGGGDFSAKRGLLPQVDLNNLVDPVTGKPLITASGIEDLIKWRNAGTANPASTYTNYVFSATNGFTTVAVAGQQILAANGTTYTVTAPGDQTFVSRQDLIKYEQANSGEFPSAALQYLGTFSRELNAPSYTPDPGRPTVQADQSFRYGNNNPGNLNDDGFNPSLINTRVTTTIAARYSDGTPAAVGEPLIKYRFPLSRLGWLGDAGPTGTTAAGTPVSADDVLAAFGLTYSGGAWKYSHGNPSNQIMSLAQVAAAGREPDFFELLQAAITVGSLGKGGQNQVTQVLNDDSNVDYQIMQIGANVIAQYKSTSFPPRIDFDVDAAGNPREFVGVENLPYLLRVFITAYRLHGSGSPTTVGAWVQPQIWNPHAEANTPPSATTGPTQFRFYVQDPAFPGKSTAATVTYQSSNAPPVVTSPPYSPSAGITFNSSPAFSSPTMLVPGAAGLPQAGGDDAVSDAGNTFVGVCLGKAQVVDSRVNTDPHDPAYYSQVYDWTFTQPNGIDYELQYAGPGGAWVTYNRFRDVEGGVGIHDNYDAYPGVAFQNYGLSEYNVVADPRTDRFGSFLSDDDTFSQNTPATPYPVVIPTDTPYVLPSDDTRYFAIAGTPAGGEWLGWVYPNPGPWGAGTIGVIVGYMSDNLSPSLMNYKDPDGVQRPADGAYTQGAAATTGSPPTSTTGGYPLLTDSIDNPYSRPIMLNRPFRSVAEMGYASRGEPWKSLDFFTAESGDAALLDLFCLNESPRPPSPVQSTAAVAEAGRIDLNTRQVPVLQAALTGAIMAEDEPPAPVTITPANAKFLAQNLVTHTSTAPLLNRSELVTRWISDSSITADPAVAPTEMVIKRRREAAVRALADIGNVRTWNLLIDVIAQSGRYAPTATNLNQFTVEGERHYWLHVALDRYTNKVVAQSLEPVNE